MQEQSLKLIYVLKIGTNTRGEGLYEFIFSKDPSFSNEELKDWGWYKMPANNQVEPPSEKYIDTILSLKTDKINLICLHELNDRAYIDGYYTIQALAWLDPDDDTGDMMYDELPIIVFHYGMKMQEVKDALYTRDLVGTEIAAEKAATHVKLSQKAEDEDEDYYTDEDELIVN